MTDIRRYIVRDDQIRDRAAADVARVPVADDKGRPRFQVVIKPFKRSRSLAQNSILHLWMQHISTHYAETHGEWHAPEVWKQYLKALFLGEQSSEMPGGRIVTITRHTSALSVGEFTELLEKIDMWCAEELSLMLPHPQDLYIEAMGRRV